MSAANPYLIIVAGLLYVTVAVAAVLAARDATLRENRIFWLSCAAFFMILAIARTSGFEAFVTSSLRGWLYAEGAYQDRREIQRPLAAAAVIVVGAALFWFWLKRPPARATSRAWARFGGMVGTAAMCGVIAMRLISFHELDRLLYGPIRLNWILDLGSSGLVAVSAWRYRSAA